MSVGHYAEPSVSSPRLSGVTSSRQHIIHFACQNTGLQSSAQSDHLVRIDALVWLLARQLLNHFLDHGHARRATHQYHGVQLFEAFRPASF